MVLTLFQSCLLFQGNYSKKSDWNPTRTNRDESMKTPFRPTAKLALIDFALTRFIIHLWHLTGLPAHTGPD